MKVKDTKTIGPRSRTARSGKQILAFSTGGELILPGNVRCPISLATVWLDVPLPPASHPSSWYQAASSNTRCGTGFVLAGPCTCTFAANGGESERDQ